MGPIALGNLLSLNSNIVNVGRCKSAFHQFLFDMMQDVIDTVRVSGNETKPVFLPHCTRDKFGDI